MESEILVHITAPSAARDDANYRMLTDAYLGFTCHNRVNIDQQDVDAEINLPHLHTSRFSQVSFSSVWDNVGSPQVQIVGEGLLNAEDVALREEESWVAPPSEVPDSMPDNDVHLSEFCSPTRTLDAFLQADRTIDITSSNVVSSQSSPAASERSPKRILPEGPSSLVASSNFQEPGSNPPVVIQHVTSSLLPSSTPLRVPSSLVGKTAQSNVSDAPRESSIPLPVREDREWLLSALDILSPEPQVSIDPISAKVPPRLLKLSKDLNIAHRFRPKVQARTLDPFERGYWLLIISDWDVELTRRTWAFLGDFVHRGHAGWGTRCFRDEKWEWIRLYGWGYLVGELYLLVYTASERWAKRQDMDWFDGAGDVTITVAKR